MRTLCRRYNNQYNGFIRIKKNIILTKTSYLYWCWLWLPVALFICYPAGAIISHETGIIHGRSPTAHGVIYLLQPDGVTEVRQNDILSLSHSPQQFSLSEINKGLTLSDEDDDIGLTSFIDISNANITWRSAGKELSDAEKLISFAAANAEGKKYQVTVQAPVLVNSASGVPFNDMFIISRTYQLEVTSTNLRSSLSKYSAQRGGTIVLTVQVANNAGERVEGVDVIFYSRKAEDRQAKSVLPITARINGEERVTLKTGSDGRITVDITDMGPGLRTEIVAKIENNAKETIHSVIFTVPTSPDTDKARYYGHMPESIEIDGVTFLRPKLGSEISSSKAHRISKEGEQWAVFRRAYATDYCPQNKMPTKEQIANLYTAYPNGGIKEEFGWPVDKSYWTSSMRNGFYLYKNMRSGELRDHHAKNGKFLISCIE